MSKPTITRVRNHPGIYKCEYARTERRPARTVFKVRWRAGGTREGKETSATFGTLKEATSFHAALVANGYSTPPEWLAPAALGAPVVRRADDGSRVSFKEACERYLVGHQGIQARTRVEYRNNAKRHVHPIIGHMLADEVTVDHIEQLITSMTKAGASAATVDLVMYSVVSPVFNWMIRQRRFGVSGNPCVGARRPKVSSRPVQADHVLMPEDDPEAFIADAYKVKPRGDDLLFGDLVTWLYATGLRLSEARAIHCGDVLLSEGVLHLRRTMRRAPSGVWAEATDSGKTDESFATLSLPAEALSIARRRTAGAPADAYLFRGAFHGNALHVTTIYNWWKKLREVSIARGFSKAEKLTPHKLRHGHATLLIDAGHALDHVRTRLRHKSIVTTSRYTHLTARGDQAMLDTISAVMSGKPRLRVVS